MKKIVLIVSALALIGCEKKEAQKPYPSEIITNFVYSCVQNGSELAMCGRMMDSIRSQISFQKYAELETKFLATNQMPDELAQILSKARLDAQK